MIQSRLFNQAYILCIQSGRYEIIPELHYMDVATLSGLVAWLCTVLEC
jgi:energy-converting hydrogenase Eha subunit C